MVKIKSKTPLLPWVSQALAEPTIQQRRLIKIDRTRPFDPNQIRSFGQGWTIEGQDERSLALKEIDLSEIQFLSGLRGNEVAIKGEKRLSRMIRSDYVCLDAQIALAIIENSANLHNFGKWNPPGDVSFISFEGTVMFHPSFRRCALTIFWISGEWCIEFRGLGGRPRSPIFSAVIIPGSS